MNSLITFNNFLAYSPKSQKSFFTEFDPGFNIIYGKNTSGKSTLIESILYTFGINDERHKLFEVLQEGVIFRLDFTINKKDSIKKQITVIRDDEVIYIKSSSQVKKFIGIGGNGSFEHKKLKSFWAELFQFGLFLEGGSGYTPAPIEAMFLPFYVAQDVGWVYRHKSFRGLDFIKNFKQDFFDYYLGVINNTDRAEKNALDGKILDLKNQLNFFSSIERMDPEISVSRLLDNTNIFYAKMYLQAYKDKMSQLITLEQEYLSKNNNLTFLENRITFLKRVKQQLNRQNPENALCPTCEQKLPDGVEYFYRYFQDENDTNNQLEKIKQIVGQMKTAKSSINQLSKKIDSLQNDICQFYETYEARKKLPTSFESWLEAQVNIKLSKNLSSRTAEITYNLKKLEQNFEEKYNTRHLNYLRNEKEAKFSSYFIKNLIALRVKPFDDERYTKIYKIPAFPKQGVELLKTLLAYYFAFYAIIQSASHVNIFPLLLDAIFKEDIDEENKADILKFISNNSKAQSIFSIASSNNNRKSIAEYNHEFFDSKAKLICIGENTRERAFLSAMQKDHLSIISETLSMLNA